MKKGVFKIKQTTYNNGWEMVEVEGLISKDFGIFKVVDEVKNISCGYSVTHLRTGAKVAVFDLLRMARDYVKRLEQAIFPVPWDSSSVAEDFKPNATKAIEIRNVVIRNGYNKEN